MSDSESDEEMAETAAKLDSALDSTDSEGSATTESKEGTESSGQLHSDSSEFIREMQRGLRDGLLESLGGRDSESTGSGLGEQFGHLLGEMVVRKLTAQIRQLRKTESEADIDDLDSTELIQREVDTESLSGDILSDMKDDIEDGQQVIEETGELLETVDVMKLLGAIDVSELPEVIDTTEVPAAIANAEPERAVELRKLASLVEFDELWDAVDVREFVRNKGELEDAVGEVTGDRDDGSAENSSLTDSVGSANSLGSDSSADVEGEMSLGEQGETMQVALQSKLRDAVEEFRGGVLNAREQMGAARDEAQATVEEKTGGGTGQPSSRNPTAYSTMVSGWKSSGWSSASFSTVPQETRHSGTPGHFRIYGSRFENREDDDE